MVVVDAITYGVAQVVGRVTTEQLRASAAELGYAELSREETASAYRALRAPYPPSPADLWRLAWLTRSHRGVFARVWADSGRYVIEVIVASLDGTGPFVARETSGADDLRAAADRALRAVLPPPSAWQGAEPTFTLEPAAPGAASGASAGVAGGVGERRAMRRSVRDELGEPAGRDGRRWRPSEPDIRRLSIALQTEASIGTTQGNFYNHFVGLRVDVRLVRDVILGLYGAYANLDGRAGRVHDFFFMLQLDGRVRPSNTLDLTIPLRFGVGYLPFNGPVVRASAGVAYALDPHWELEADLVAPTFYGVPSRLAVAFDFAAELSYRF